MGGVGCLRHLASSSISAYILHDENTTQNNITDDLIYDNADRGIQLYPNSKGTLVEGNVVDGNGQNIVFGGSGNNAASDNTVRNNVISNSLVGWNVPGNWNPSSKAGWDNEVHDNCVGVSSREPEYNQTGGISPAEYGFDAYHDNLIAEPTYANRKTGDFGLGSDGACEAVIKSPLIAPDL